MTRTIIAVGGGPSFKGKAGAMLSDGGDVVWVPAGVDAVAALRGSDEAPHAVLVAPDVEGADAIGIGKHVAEHAPTTAVVVLRASVTNGFLPAAMKAGVRDVIDLSSGEDAYGAVSRAVAWAESVRVPVTPHHQARTRGRVITVFSSKGGSGKSFLACNLAAALAAGGGETAIVDVDVAMGDAFAYFGKQSTHHLTDVLSLASSAEPDAIKSAATPLAEHLYGFATPPDPAAEPVAAQDMKALIGSIAGAFEYVVVDAPGGYADPVLTALDCSDEILLLASLDVVALRHLAKAIETLTSIGIGADRMRVVLNRSDSLVGLTPKDVEHVLDLKVDSMIPSSRLVPASLNAGTPVVLAEPRSDVAKSVKHLAERLAGVTSARRSSKRRLFSRS